MSLTYKDLEELFLERQNFSQPFKYQFDSRSIEKGDIFFALKGEKVNGEDFLKEVSKKGAFAAVVEKGYKKEDFGLWLYRVDDVLETMQKLAKKALEMKKAKIIALTGSVGKTTTREFSYNLLSASFKVSRNIKSYNSQIGLSHTLLNMEREQDIILLEMGISQRGEMDKLANMVKPHIALFTPIGLVHAGNFDGVEEIIKEKTKMIDLKRTKLIIAPLDLMKHKIFFGDIKTLSYSIKSKRADYFLYTKNDKIFIKGEHEAVFPKIFSETHFLENFLASYILAKEFEIKNDKIEEKLTNLRSQPLRFEKVERKGILFIQDCYNANSLSMIASLENLPKVKGKKIAVLGQMGELGKYSKESHEAVGRVAAQNVDILFCYFGDSKFILDSFRKEGLKSNIEKQVFYFDDLEKLALKLKSLLKKDDLLLIKGARSLCLERLIDLLAI